MPQNGQKRFSPKNKQGAPIFQARSPIFPHPTRLQGKLTAYRPPGRGSPPPYMPIGKADTVAPSIVQCNPTLMPTGKAANRDSIRPKVFEEEGGGLEGGGETFSRKFPLPPPISSYIPTAFFRAATSAGVSSRASPGFMTPRRKGPCATRTSRRMVRCRSRHMRRICRFRP